jgi:hypothetical protein
MRTSDHPGEWRDHAFAEYEPDSGTSVYPGSLLIQLDDLRPEPGMLGRAVAASHHVGWSHYMRHHAAVYRTERQARAAARSAIERSQPPANQRRSRRRGSVRATNLDAPALDRDVYAKFRVKTWRMPAGKNHTAMDVTSTDTLAVIRRGRMVATYACAAKGEDVETAHKLLKMVIRKLERADCRLTD